jgi:integrase
MQVKDLRKRKQGYQGDKPWWARYRDEAGKEHSKTFRTKGEASTWLSGQVTAKARGEWIDPALGRVTFREYAAEYRAMQIHRPHTAINLDSVLRVHVYPVIGDYPIGQIRLSHLQALVKAMSGTLAASTVRTNLAYITPIFQLAVQDRVIPTSPCQGVKLPKADRPTEIRPLTFEQVQAIAGAMPGPLKALVLGAAGTGLRQGELLGLTIDRVDFMRGWVHVDRQLPTVHSKALGHAPLKTRASYRSVPLAKSIGFIFAAHLQQFPVAENGLVFTDEGNPWARRKITTNWRRAADRAGLPKETFHATRHFYASTLIQYGESVVVVQKRLGHASATETLNTYAHLWPNSEKGTNAAVDAVFNGEGGQDGEEGQPAPAAPSRPPRPGQTGAARPSGNAAAS